MRPSTLPLVLLVSTLLAGCAGLVRREAGDSQPTQAAASLDDAQKVAAHLATLSRLDAGSPALQAAITEKARLDFVNSPTSSHELHYALILATPGHADTDLEGARQLLGSLLATPDRLSKSERALALVVFRDISRLQSARTQLEDLKAEQQRGEKAREAEAARRLQALSADNARLRKELQDAQTKLEAIAELEKALATRHGDQGTKP